MDKFIKETKRRPRLVNKTIVQIPEPPAKLSTINLPLKEAKWNLNIILLLFFVLFGAFFLYNCKYGFFKIVDIEPYAFNSST